MIKITKRNLVLSLCLVFCQKALCLEVYRFVEGACVSSTGLIVSVDSNFVYLLGVDGKSKKIKKKSIKHILVYNIINNPISTIYIDSTLKNLVKNIYLSDSKDPKLTAFPIRFVEDMIVFYDLGGKSNYINQDSISAIKF